MKIIDLRSDTVTRPTLGMWDAMRSSSLGDDVFGDDPTVNLLQEKIASLLGFEAALFVPSGTQSNLCGLMSHCQRGDEYIVGQMAHTFRWEAGGAAVLGSVQPQPIANQPDGTISLQEIEDSIKPDDAHFARTTLLCLENTMGGKVLPFEYMKQATALAKSRGICSHLDGARLFNAAVAQALQNKTDAKSEAKKIAQLFDSVSVCFSKGLGAPVGSALCGTKDFISRAHRIRKMLGGGMRQAGVLAGAAVYALDNHIDRLAEDHSLAQKLGDTFQKLPGITVEPVHTNIVFPDFSKCAPGSGETFSAHLQQHGILVTGTKKLRFVTHLDVDALAIEKVCQVAKEYFS
jgi:threonine aldolase